jgi:hypothetical protein
MESDEALALDYFSGLIERARDDDELRHALFKICNDNNYALIDIEFWRPRSNEKPTDAEHEAVEQFRLLVTVPLPLQQGDSDDDGGTVNRANSSNEPRWDDLVAGNRRIQTDNGYHYDFTKPPEDHTAVKQLLSFFPHHASSRAPSSGPRGPEYLGDDPLHREPDPFHRPF